MEIQFLGAARTITGSMHRVKANGKQFLLDCGTYEGPRTQSRDRNVLTAFFDPAKIDETKPDYLLILPWNFRDEVIKQMAHIRSWGGKFVVPIPEVRVYP